MEPCPMPTGSLPGEPGPSGFPATEYHLCPRMRGSWDPVACSTGHQALREANMLSAKGFTLCAGVLLGWAASASAQIRPGDPAPDFVLQDVSGATYTLSQFRGKVVLLAFWGYS